MFPQRSNCCLMTCCNVYSNTPVCKYMSMKSRADNVVKHFDWIGFPEMSLNWVNQDMIEAFGSQKQTRLYIFSAIASRYLSVVSVMSPETCLTSSDEKKKNPPFPLAVFHTFKENCNAAVSQLTSYMSRLLLRFHDDLRQKKFITHLK